MVITLIVIYFQLCQQLHCYTTYFRPVHTFGGDYEYSISPGRFQNNSQTLTAVNGSWSEWTQYGECTKTCGDGQRRRTRRCDNPEPKYGGKDCSGSDSQTEKCNIMNCPNTPYWGSWSKFSECSVTCGRGYQSRIRNCLINNTKVANEKCSGQADSQVTCDLDECVVSSAKTEFSAKDSGVLIASISLSALVVLGAGIAIVVVLRKKRNSKNAKFITVLEQ